MKAICICGLLVAALPAAGSEPLALSVTPTQSFAPATLHVRARIEPHGANRVLALIVDGADFYRSSELPLDGDQAPKTVEMSIRSVPAGEYIVSGVLVDAVGHQRAIAHQAIRVLGELSH